MYQNCDTEPQPRDGAPRGARRLDLGGQADGPNGGLPARVRLGRCDAGWYVPDGRR